MASAMKNTIKNILNNRISLQGYLLSLNPLHCLNYFPSENICSYLIFSVRFSLTTLQFVVVAAVSRTVKKLVLVKIKFWCSVAITIRWGNLETIIGVSYCNFASKILNSSLTRAQNVRTRFHHLMTAAAKQQKLVQTTSRFLTVYKLKCMYIPAKR